jgi:hypothetical protein
VLLEKHGMMLYRIIRHKRIFFPTAAGTAENQFDTDLTEEIARPCRAACAICTAVALLSGMAGLPDSISYPQAAGVILALSMLRQTRSVMGAIKQADIASGVPQPVVPIGPHPNKLGGRRLQDDKYEPRRVIEPEPRYLPREIIRQRPRVIACAPVCKPPEPLPPLDPACPEGTPVSRFKIQPPWKTLPWENPLPVQPIPKVVVRMIDKNHKGQMLDLFI